MKSKLLYAAVLVSLAAAVTCPRVASAQTEVHSWTMCTPGSFNSCQSLQLTTTDVFSGFQRIGTDVTVVMHNLNGQIANDNSIWSGLELVDFSLQPMASYIPGYNPADWGYNPALPSYTQLTQPLTMSGPATGGASWFSFVQTGAVGTEAAGVYLGGRSPANPTEIWGYVGGCTPGSYSDETNGVNFYTYSTTAMTCGSAATATVSFSTGVFLNAEWLQATILVRGDAGAGNWYGGECVSGDSPYPGLAGCTMLADSDPWASATPAPEPVTIALLGTGLLGIGAVRWRRRKRDGTVDA